MIISHSSKMDLSLHRVDWLLNFRHPMMFATSAKQPLSSSTFQEIASLGQITLDEPCLQPVMLASKQLRAELIFHAAGVN